MAHHWRTPKETATAPVGAGRAMLLVAGLMFAGVIAMHVLAVRSGVEVAATPAAFVR